VDNPLGLSDAEFLEWAGAQPQRWALLSAEKREAWLDHLVARIKAAPDAEQRNAYWRVAYVIACADAVHPGAFDPVPVKDHAHH
jgi:hypothetical protein